MPVMRTISERCVVVGRSFLEGDDDVRPIDRPHRYEVKRAAKQTPSEGDLKGPHRPVTTAPALTMTPRPVEAASWS